MIRRIIDINEEKCNGCGICAKACHENAIGIVDGKARLLRDDYCDGLGDCLPTCPTGAISFIEREAAEYNEEAVKSAKNKNSQFDKPLPSGCPGSMSKSIERAKPAASNNAQDTYYASELRQWPVQIKLAPIEAPYFDGANLLIAADCTAYAYGSFHSDFMKNKTVLIGCPKLDSEDYSKKLTDILRLNNVKSLTVVRMEVPCCGGIEHAAVTALKNSGKFIPWQVYTISTDGRIIN